MTIFASKTAESMNGDEFPWRNPNSRDPFASRWSVEKPYPGVLESNVFDPRHEFTPTTTHEANPVLVAFREEDAYWQTDTGGFPRSERARNWVEDLADGEIYQDATPAQIDHARRVLTRLAKFTKEQTR